MTDDLRTRAKEAAEERWSPSTVTDPLPGDYIAKGKVSGFVDGALWHAAQQPTREDIRDELAHWPIGHGYESDSVSIDDAGDMADAVLALLDGAGS